MQHLALILDEKDGNNWTKTSSEATVSGDERRSLSLKLKQVWFSCTLRPLYKILDKTGLTRE